MRRIIPNGMGYGHTTMSDHTDLSAASRDAVEPFRGVQERVSLRRSQLHTHSSGPAPTICHQQRKPIARGCGGRLVVSTKILQACFDPLETFAELVELRRQRVGFGAL
jgi:hypothetical protein